MIFSSFRNTNTIKTYRALNKKHKYYEETMIITIPAITVKFNIDAVLFVYFNSIPSKL